MTKEELEKEAEEKYSDVDREFIACQDEGEVFNIGYILGAEPREKRIAELEEELKDWKDEWQEQVQKATDEGYARTLQTIQLSKAKEIIQGLIHEISVFYIATDRTVISPTVKQAEQFLKEIEK